MDGEGRSLIDSSRDVDDESTEFITKGNVDVVGDEVSCPDQVNGKVPSDFHRSVDLIGIRGSQPNLDGKPTFRMQGNTAGIPQNSARQRPCHASAHELSVPGDISTPVGTQLPETASAQDWRVRTRPLRLTSVSNHELRMPDVATFLTHSLAGATPALSRLLTKSESDHRAPTLDAAAGEEANTRPSGRTLRVGAPILAGESLSPGASAARSPTPSRQESRLSRRDSDSSTYYDTVSSTSSTTPLLRHATGIRSGERAPQTERFPGDPKSLAAKIRSVFSDDVTEEEGGKEEQEEEEEYTLEYQLHPRHQYPKVFVEKVEKSILRSLLFSWLERNQPLANRD